MSESRSLIQECEKALADVGLLPARKLAEYMAALLEINAITNLTGAKTPFDLALKHIADSYYAWSALGGLKHAVYDVGSGGGLPGVVLAILSPNTPVTLIERRGKKAKCLEDIVSKIGLNKQIEVIAGALEETKQLDPEAEMWFRGFLPGVKLATYFSTHFKSEDLPRIVLMKGPGWNVEKSEIAAMKKLDEDWRERLISAAEISYKLPQDAGERLLVLV